jgi:hypothetical protein
MRLPARASSTLARSAWALAAASGVARGGDPPENVQPVAELAFLHVADEAVDPGDRLGQGRGPVEPQIGLHPGRRRLGADIGLQAVAAARIKAVGIGKSQRKMT